MRALSILVLSLSIPAFAAEPADVAAKEDACLVQQDYKACAGLAYQARMRMEQFQTKGEALAEAACEAGDPLACVAFVDILDKETLIVATRRGCRAGSDEMCATAAMACNEDPDLCQQPMAEALAEACASMPEDADDEQRAKVLAYASLGSLELQGYMAALVAQSPKERKRMMRSILKDAGLDDCRL